MQTLVASVDLSWDWIGAGLAQIALAPVRRLAPLSCLLHLPAVQPLLARMGRLRARAVLHKARALCPAYRDLWMQSGASGTLAPVTTKENYIRGYPIAARCYGARVPGGGTTVDESSGSSGTPNQWVRSRAERRETVRSIQAAFRHVFPGRDRILLNCFALGPWATGMTVSLALSDLGILKSVGADAAKLENALRSWGPSYRYLVLGYPPFLKNFFATTSLDLSGYHLDLIVGGEGMSEALRDRLLTQARSVTSSYGASDLEINLGLETARTVSLRRACADDPDLCRALWGRDTPPMLFQYNPLDYVIETLPSGELAFTVNRLCAACPKIRYNLHDLGGTMPWRDLEARLCQRGRADLTAGMGRHSAFPLLWVWGRSDSVPFCGAKVFPADVEAVLSSPDAPIWTRNFQITAGSNDTDNTCLYLDLEAVAEAEGRAGELARLQTFLYNGLRQVNQDFREVTRGRGADCVQVTVHTSGTGPFACQDARIKNQYVAR